MGKRVPKVARYSCHFLPGPKWTLHWLLQLILYIAFSRVLYNYNILKKNKSRGAFLRAFLRAVFAFLRAVLLFSGFSLIFFRYLFVLYIIVSFRPIICRGMPLSAFSSLRKVFLRRAVLTEKTSTL